MQIRSNTTLIIALAALLAVPFAACSGGGGGGGGGPKGLVASANNSGEVNLAWNAVKGATSYNVYWSTTSGVTISTGTPIIGAGSPFTHSGLSNGTVYYYVVTGVKGTKESKESKESSAMPLDPPTGVSATPSVSQVTLDWNPVVGADAYSVYWSTSPGVNKVLGTEIAGAAPPIVHAGVSSGTIYYYVVTARNSTGGGSESTDSAEVSARPDVQGILDPTFGGTGFITHDNAAGGNGGDVGAEIAVDAAGRILVAGYSLSSINFDMAVWRFNPDGTFDPSFNGVGWFVHDGAAGGAGPDLGEAIAVDSSDRILAAGYSDSGADWDMVVWRLLPDGSLDTAFNGQGWVAYHDAGGGNGDDIGRDIALDGMGRIVVAGHSIGPLSNDEMVVWRLLPDGSLDTSFNSQGWVVHANAGGGNGDDQGWAITTDAFGRILVAGESMNLAFDDDMVIWRFSMDGTLDVTFNSQGWLTHDNAAGGMGNDRGRAIAIDAASKIVVAGHSWRVSGDLDMAVWRFFTSGAPDLGFSGSGSVTHHSAAGGGGSDSGNAILIDGAGRIYAAGSSASPGSLDLAVWRLNQDGTLDTQFNSIGWVTHNDAAGGNGDDFATGIAREATGKIVAAGRSLSGGFPFGDDMAIWRYR